MDKFASYVEPTHDVFERLVATYKALAKGPLGEDEKLRLEMRAFGCETILQQRGYRVWFEKGEWHYV